MLFFRLLLRAAKVWMRGEADQHAAALAYFTPFALTPLIIFSITIVGFFFGSDQVTEILIGWGSQVDAGVTELLRHSVQNFDLLTSRYYLPVIGLVFLTTMIFIALNSLMIGLHKMWGIEVSGLRSLPSRFWRIIVFVSVIEFYLVGVVMMGEIISWLSKLLGMAIWPVFVFSVTFCVTVVLLFLAYSLLALGRPSQRGRFFGALLAALVLLFSREIVALHFSTAPVQSLFGAAGLLITLLVWVYVGAGVVLYGAAFARVFDEATGRRVLPPTTTR